MINGDICTRSCTFCNIRTGRPTAPLDPDEPRRVAEAAAVMQLDHVVVTSVNRDEQSDGGAGQFAAVIREIRARRPEASVEVLIPDFKGDRAALDIVFAERPDVLNHNVETVPRLYKEVRPQARYRTSLEVLRAASEAGLVTKSGFMLGLGETYDEIEDVLRDVRDAGVHLVTIGQYLRPTPIHHPIVRYATPEEFEHWREFGLSLGFSNVDSGPLVRSSYHAKGSFARARGG
jgi:lipoic acid synthetase